MSRKGIPNKRTVFRQQKRLREAEAIAEHAHKTHDPILLMDSLAILQSTMRYFYRKHAEALARKKPDETRARAYAIDAASIADKIIPFEHHRLAALKLSHDPAANSVNSETTAAQLKAEIMAEIAELGLVPMPTGVANRVSKGSTSSH